MEGAKATPFTSPFNVMLQQPELVTPAEPTASQDQYFLTNIDQAFNLIMNTVDFFEASPAKPCEDPAKTIKEALKKVLVHYYPLAGRLGRTSPDGTLNVLCNDEGVVYVEAEADTSLSALPQLATPDQPWLGKLVCQVLAGASNILEKPLVAVQVTKFQCGGFVLALSVNHHMLDGISAFEFLNSWGEVARGLPLSTPPYIDRSLVKARIPPQITYPHNEFVQIDELLQKQHFLPGEDIVFKSFCFSEESLKRLKTMVMEDGELAKCTTFEALSGLVWQSRTKAMGMVPEQKTRFMVSVDWRNRIEPPMPKGYMGNAIYPAHSLTTVGELTTKPLSHAVKKVQVAISLISGDYIRSAIDYMEVKSVSTPSLAATLMITNWARLTVHPRDFGWGEPTYSGPVLLQNKELVLFLGDCRDRKSINVLVGLRPHAMEAFDQLIQPHL